MTQSETPLALTGLIPALIDHHAPTPTPQSQFRALLFIVLMLHTESYTSPK